MKKEDPRLQGLCKECTHRNSCADAKRYLNVTGCTSCDYRSDTIDVNNSLKALSTRGRSNPLSHMRTTAYGR